MKISIIDRFDFLVEHFRCPRCGDTILKKSRIYCVPCGDWLQRQGAKKARKDI